MNAGEGGSVYPKCQPFTVDEICKHIGIYIFYELTPSPQVEMKFQSSKRNEVNGNSFIYGTFGTIITEKYREFKAFLAAVDPAKLVSVNATHAIGI